MSTRVTEPTEATALCFRAGADLSVSSARGARRSRFLAHVVDEPQGGREGGALLFRRACVTSSCVRAIGPGRAPVLPSPTVPRLGPRHPLDACHAEVARVREAVTLRVISAQKSIRRGERIGTYDWRHRARFRGRDHRGPDPLPRLDRRLVGGAVLAPEGLHAGLHDRARLHGEDQAGVRQAQREDHRPLGRSDSDHQRLGRATSRRRRARRRTTR